MHHKDQEDALKVKMFRFVFDAF